MSTTTEPLKANQTLETNYRPTFTLNAGGNSDAPFTLNIASPAAVAQLCVRRRAQFELS